MHPFSNKRLILVFLGLLWLEMSILPLCAIGGIKPDFFFIFLTFYAFQVGWRMLIPVALAVGIAKDLITNSFFGIETASMVVGALALQFLAIQFDRDKTTIQMVALFIFSFLTLAFFSLISFAVKGSLFWSQFSFTKIFLISCYTTAVGFFVFPFLNRCKQILYDKQYELF